MSSAIIKEDLSVRCCDEESSFQCCGLSWKMLKEKYTNIHACSGMRINETERFTGCRHFDWPQVEGTKRFLKTFSVSYVSISH